MQRAFKLLLIAQLSLFIGLMLCTLLIPRFLFERNEGGVSNYGLYAKTVVPYSFGFGICGVATILAARSLPKDFPQQRVLRLMLTILGVLYILALASTYPYKLNTAFDQVHHYAGAALVLYSVGVGAWLTVRKVKATAALLLFCAQFAGFLLGLLTYFGFLHTLFIAEILESTAFGALLVVSVARLSRLAVTTP